jgi:mannose-6-phosphate isomerase-like protein (cupin superfamily)
MALTEGQSLKKHTTPVDVFFYILEGKGEVEIGEERQSVEKDMSFYVFAHGSSVALMPD